MGHCSFLVAHVLAILLFLGLASSANQSVFRLGIVLDLNSSMGSMADLCIRMSLSDFYSAHPNCTTRLEPHIKNADTVVDATFKVLDLMNNEQVVGILGQLKQIENTFIAELGKQFHVPVISFAPGSSTLPYKDNPYFFRTTPDDEVQARALAAICDRFEWPEVVVLYEDTDYGNQFLSHLNKAFQEVKGRLVYNTPLAVSVEDSHLLEVLKNLTVKQMRVFLVHMNPSLGYRLFNCAKSIEAMSEGYAWIISDSMSNFMSSIGSDTHDSMEGVVGVRPYIYQSKEVKHFQERWKRNVILEKSTVSTAELNVHGLWAYDAITALATAVEKIGPINSTSFYEEKFHGISTVGSKLLDQLSRTRVRGLTGEFQLVDGKLNQSVFEIFNLQGSGDRILGFWTPDRGIIRELIPASGVYSTSMKKLKTVIWPGDTVNKPTGRPTENAILKVGLPWGFGFMDFVNATDLDNPTGFAIDMFLAAKERLPFTFKPKFIRYSDTKSFDDMLCKIPQEYDMVVGDSTIWAPRAQYVEFSLPYSETGVVLVVKNKKPFDMWIFTRPYRWDLWLAIGVACILMGIVIHKMERGVTRKSEDQIVRANKEKLGTFYWSPVAVLAFPERNMVSSNWSFFVLVFWMFMAFILMQSYTANLSAMLTVDQLNFAFSDNYYIGYLEGSFMKQFLMTQLNINESRLRSYSSAEEYHVAMSKGSKNNGIDAIFDEIPYMKIFLHKYDSQYKMIGPTYRTGGFGFAFPVGSPLASNFSKAILNVTQGPYMTALERKNFGPGYSSQDPLSSTISQGTSSLTLYDFAGLFLIVGSVTIITVFCSETRIGRKLVEKVCRLVQKCCRSKTSKVDPAGDTANGDIAESGVEEIHDSVSNVSASSPGEVTNGHDVGESAEDSDEEIHEIVPINETRVQ